MKNEKAQVSTYINAAPETVWEALTNPELIKKYFFGTKAESDWKEGSPIRFTGEWEGKTYEDKGTILKVDQNSKFVYDYWSSMSGIVDKPENYVIVTYDLKKEGTGTQLTITQENIPDEKMKEHSEQNWNKVLEDLKKLIEKGIPAYI